MKNCKWLLLFGALLSYFVNPYLPFSWGWENSVLEWLQVGILACGLVLNCIWWQQVKAGNNLPNARFLAGAMPLWLLMIGREVSWGRAFYPNGFDSVTGPSFLTMTEISYGPLVHPLLAVIIIVWLYVVIKHDLYKIPYRLLKEGRFPITEFVIAIVAFVVADIGEHILHFQTMEEFTECFAYLGLILTAYKVKIALQEEK